MEGFRRQVDTAMIDHRLLLAAERLTWHRILPAVVSSTTNLRGNNRCYHVIVDKDAD